MPLAIALLLTILGTPASAHGINAPVTPGDVWGRWTFDPWVLGPLFLVHWLYGRGVLRLWAKAGRGRAISPWRVIRFLAGEASLLVALVSPLAALAGTLFSAHMVQHAILIAVAPPLLLAGLPDAALPWALPTGFRRGLAREPALRNLGRALGWVSRPLPAAILHGAAVWLWHMPPLFDAAVENEALHTLEHFSFFGTAYLFWRSLFVAGRSAFTAPAALAGVFFTLVHGCFLAALITFASRPMYAAYLGKAETWGLDAIADQQLAGLIMGAPLTLVYLAAAVVIANRLLAPAKAYC